jgi:hypothetical protein
MDDEATSLLRQAQLRAKGVSQQILTNCVLFLQRDECQDMFGLSIPVRSTM